MKLYIDLTAQKLITAPGYSTPVESLVVKRGDKPIFELTYLEDATEPTLLPANSSIVFAAKVSLDYDGEVAAFCDEWAAPVAGEYAYRAVPNFNTTKLNEVLAVDGAAANDVASVTLMAEISWATAVGVATTQTFKLVVANDVYRGNETSPVPATPAYPAPAALLLKAHIGSLVPAADGQGGSGSGGEGIAVGDRSFGYAFPLTVGTDSFTKLRRTTAGVLARNSIGYIFIAPDGEVFQQVTDYNTAGFEVGIDGKTVVAVGYGLYMYSSDGGSSWIKVDTESTLEFSASYGQSNLAVSPTGRWVTFNGGRIFYMDGMDGIGSWVAVEDHGVTGTISSVAYFDGAWWFGSRDGKIHRTANFTTWEHAQVAADDHEFIVFGKSGTRLLAGGFCPNLYVLNSGETAWSIFAELTPDFSTFFRMPQSIDYIDGEFYIPGWGKSLVRTKDGTSLERLSIGGFVATGSGFSESPYFYSLLKSPDGLGYLLAADGGIWKIPAVPGLGAAPRHGTRGVVSPVRIIDEQKHCDALHYDESSGHLVAALCTVDGLLTPSLASAVSLTSWVASAAPMRLCAFASTSDKLVAVGATAVYEREQGASNLSSALVLDSGRFTAVAAAQSLIGRDRYVAWLAVGDAGLAYFKSPNGSPAAVVIPNSGDLTAVAYGNGRWVVGGWATDNGYAFFAFSKDAKNWTRSAAPGLGIMSYAPKRIEFSPRWGFVALVGSELFSSYDGEHWGKLGLLWSASCFTIGPDERLFVGSSDGYLMGMLDHGGAVRVASMSLSQDAKIVATREWVVAVTSNEAPVSIQIAFLSRVDPAQVGTFGTALAAYTADNQSAALATYTSDPESTEYTEATVANLNALRVAYENLRVVCEADRVRFAAVLAAYENLRASHEDLRAKLIAAGVVS